MVKNTNYWDTQKVKLKAIDIPYFSELSTTRLNLYLDKKIDLVGGLSRENAEEADREGHKLHRYLDGVLFYLEFNFRKGRVTANKNLRLAIAHAFNVEELVNQIIGIPGTVPGKSLFPLFLKGEKEKFRDEHKTEGFKYDLKMAKEYLEKAKKELNVEKILPLRFLTTDSENAMKQAEYFQETMRSALGLEIKIDKQIFKIKLQKAKEGEFDISSAGWGPDYDDPMTYGDLFSSWNENNNGRFKNAEYDAFVRLAQKSVSPKERMRAFAGMQSLILSEAAILPQYERALLYLKRPRLKGVIRQTLGPDPYFVYAYYEK